MKPIKTDETKVKYHKWFNFRTQQIEPPVFLRLVRPYIEKDKQIKPIKTNTTEKGKAIKDRGIIYYKAESKKEMLKEKHYFLEWKKNLIEYWKKRGNLEMQKLIKAETIRDYRNDVKRIFQNYKEIESNPDLKKELEKLWKDHYIFFLCTKNIEKIIKKVKKDVIKNETKEVRKEIENSPILKEKFKQIEKEFILYMKEQIITNYGNMPGQEEIKMKIINIVTKVFSKNLKIKKNTNKK
ncbi:MAG: hypothetical protein LBC64_02385 [Fibromonadaceae bacterium]|jgi:hypothetical protein|nr:hypothetical protein [Fibromonadaceae bacterium]